MDFFIFFCQLCQFSGLIAASRKNFGGGWFN
jgi:hypothetical protein